MNRRGFLRNLGIGTAVVAASGSIGMAGFDWFMEENPNFSPFSAEVLEYVDYTNFSQYAISASIDEMVTNTAQELSRSFGLEIDNLIKGKYPASWSEDD
jgi:hypothetical protein